MKKKKGIIILTASYGTFVLFTLLVRIPRVQSNSRLYWDYISRNIQLIPMKSILDMLNLAVSDSFSLNARVLAGINVIGNIGIMVPCGILFPLAIKQLRKMKVFLLCVVITITLIEIVQLFATVGSFDIDDIVLNSSGCIIGYFTYRKITNRLEKRP